MGPFDDLLPAAAPAPGGGPFDDLLPQQGEQKGFINNSLRVGKDAGIGFISGMAGLLGKSASVAMEMLPGVNPDERIINKIIARRRAETGAEIPDYKAPATALRENTQAAQDWLASQQSLELQQAKRAVEEADGWWETAKAYWDNPEAILDLVTTSLPSSIPSILGVKKAAAKMLVERGIKPGTEAAVAFFKDKDVVANLTKIGTALEGAVSGSDIYSQSRLAGSTPTEAAAAALPGGVITGMIGYGASKVLPDPEVAFGRSLADAQPASKNVLEAGANIAKAMFGEGVLQELPQSLQEQVFTNLGTGRPWDEGLDKAGVGGLIAGAATGGGLRTATEGVAALRAPRTGNPKVDDFLDGMDRDSAEIDAALHQAAVRNQTLIDATYTEPGTQGPSSPAPDAPFTDLEDFVPGAVRPRYKGPTPEQAAETRQGLIDAAMNGRTVEDYTPAEVQQNQARATEVQREQDFAAAQRDRAARTDLEAGVARLQDRFQGTAGARPTAAPGIIGTGTAPNKPGAGPVSAVTEGTTQNQPGQPASQAVSVFADPVPTTGPGSAAPRTGAPMPSQRVVSQPATEADTKTLNDALSTLYNDNYEGAYVPDQMQPDDQPAVSALEAVFNRRVIPIRAADPNRNPVDGVRVRGDTVYVNTQSEVDPVNVVGHELWHDVVDRRPDLAAWYGNQVRKYLTGIGQYGAELNAQLQPGENEIRGAELEEELLADFNGDALADPKFLKQLADDNPSQFKRLLDAVITRLSRMLGKLRRTYGSEKYVSDVEAMRGYLKQVLKAYQAGSPIDEVATPRRAEAKLSRAKKAAPAVDQPIEQPAGNAAPTNDTEALGYSNLDAETKAMVDTALLQVEGADKTRALLDEYKGTPWAKQAVAGARARVALTDLLAGKDPTYDNAFNSPRSAKIKNAILNRGEEAIWKYFEANGTLSHPSKPIHSVNSSFLDCQPSKACATYCYAARGRNYANILIRAELSDWAVHNQPERFAKMVAAEYKTTPEFIAGKALRLFERGDGSTPWLAFIKTLNEEGVRAHVFSKRADFLRQVPEGNVRLLSTDATNQSIAEENPDLPVAYVYTNTEEAAWLDKHHAAGGNVQLVLPVINGGKHLTAAQQSAIPKWAKPLTCPVDKGGLKIGTGKGEWNCTRCDAGGGVGCYNKQTSEKVWKVATVPLADIVRQKDKLAITLEELESVARRLDPAGYRTLHQKLDDILSQARAGLDPEREGDRAEGVHNGSVSEAGGRQGTGRDGQSTPEQGTKLSRARSPSPQVVPAAAEDRLRDPKAQAILDRMYEQADAYKPEFDAGVDDLAARFSGFPMTTALKGRPKAVGKIYKDYLGDPEQMKDILRATVVFGNYKDAAKVRQAIEARYEVVGNTRDLYAEKPHPDSSGYMDMKFNVAKDGRIYEVQANITEMIIAKEMWGHALYDLEDNADKLARNIDETKALRAAQRAIYGFALRAHKAKMPLSRFIDRLAAVATREIGAINRQYGFSINLKNSSLETRAPFLKALADEMGKARPSAQKDQPASYGPGKYTAKPSTSKNSPSAGNDLGSGAAGSALGTESAFTGITSNTSVPQATLDNIKLSRRRTPGLSQEQDAFLDKIAPDRAMKMRDRWTQAVTRLGERIQAGLYDRFAPLLKVDQAALSADPLAGPNMAHSGYVLARMSESAGGALTSMLRAGRLQYDPAERVITVDTSAPGLMEVLGRLGDEAEVDRFFGWIAAHRGRELMAQGREHLFTPQDIAAGVNLNAGTTESGENRAQLYASVKRAFDVFKDDVLNIATKSGVLDPAWRQAWQNDWYVPFYRVLDDDQVGGPNAGGGSLKPKEAFKHLKGGKQNLNDLLENTLLNFHHLLAQSLKNVATRQALENAEAIGIADATPEAARMRKASTYYFENGRKKWFNVSDPLVYNALTMLLSPGVNTASRRMMRSFKRVFTNFVTASPQFIIRNLLRDSLHSIAVSKEMSFNVPKNMAGGLGKYGFGDTFTNVRAQMLASGAGFSFGHVYGENIDDLKYSIAKQKRKTVRGHHSEGNLRHMARAGRQLWDRYHAMSDSAENANRAALFDQILHDGGSKLQAAYEARNLLDFSRSGGWPAIRFLVDTVPFLNARLQGLVRLGESFRTRQGAARFAIVVGALIASTIILRMLNDDSDDYRDLEEWDKDAQWHVFPSTFGLEGDWHITLPKPFEVGAIATIAERLYDQAFDDEATAELFRDRLVHMFLDTFSFNPIPQMFSPAFDLATNKDSFTGRDIETQGMERLSPTRRRRSSTTATAVGISELMNATLGQVAGDKAVLSPVQIDYLIQNYLGWVGATASAGLSGIYDAAAGKSKPTQYFTELQPVRSFYRDTSRPGYQKYTTEFYKLYRDVNTLAADLADMQKLGETDAIDKFLADPEHQAKLGLRKTLNQVQRQLSGMNRQMQVISADDTMDPDLKRKRLDLIKEQKNLLTEQVMRDVKRQLAASEHSDK